MLLSCYRWRLRSETEISEFAINQEFKWPEATRVGVCEGLAREGDRGVGRKSWIAIRGSRC